MPSAALTKQPSLASKVAAADAALSGRYDPVNQVWNGALPTPAAVAEALEVAILGKADPAPNARAASARKILNSYPQTLKWDAEDRGMMIAIYEAALEKACASTIEEISHPSTIPFGVHPPSAPEIAKAVEVMNRRVHAIEYRAKMINACREKAEKAPPRPSEDERRRAQERVSDFLGGVETQRTPEGLAKAKRERALVAREPRQVLTDAQKEELASVRRKMESTA